MTEITDARIDAAIEDGKKADERINVILTFDSQTEAEDKELSNELVPRSERGTLALEIRRLRKREEDARGLLEKMEWSASEELENGMVQIMLCPSCEGKDHAPDCAIAAWLKGE